VKTLQSIRTKQEFQSIFDHGLILKGKLLKVWVDYRVSGSAAERPLRLAIIVSRKTAAKATDRNTWRRRIREIMRKKYAAKFRNAAVIVVVKKSAQIAVSGEIEKEMDRLFSSVAFEQEKKRE